MAERFLKMKSGAVYRYSAALAKRKDAIVVDGHTAAAYFRSMGVENDITEKYGERAIDVPVAGKKRTTTRSKPKAAAEPKPDPAIEPPLPFGGGEGEGDGDEGGGEEAEAPAQVTGVVMTDEAASMDVIGELLKRGTDV